eukprot:3876140-Rhodomonas_salina.1
MLLRSRHACSYGHVAHAPTVTSRMPLRSRRACPYGHVTHALAVTSRMLLRSRHVCPTVTSRMLLGHLAEGGVEGGAGDKVPPRENFH